MATALEAYPRVRVVVESVGRGLYNCWRRHMADSDPALLPPPVLRSPGPLQSPLLCICCTRIKDSAVPRGPSVTMDGPMVFCSRGEGLDSPFSCLPLPPATCNLEAQGLDFYYQVLFWLTGSVIIEYERLRYWMWWPPNPRSEAAAVVNVRRVRELNGSQACDHLQYDWGPRGHFNRKQLQCCDLLLVIGGKRGEETDLYREVVRGQLTWLTWPGSSSQDLEIVTVNSNEFTTFTAPAFVSVLCRWKFLYLHQFQQPVFFGKSEIAFRLPLSVFTALSCFIYSKSIFFSAPVSPFWIVWNPSLKLCQSFWILF